MHCNATAYVMCYRFKAQRMSSSMYAMQVQKAPVMLSFHNGFKLLQCTCYALYLQCIMDELVIYTMRGKSA